MRQNYCVGDVRCLGHTSWLPAKGMPTLVLLTACLLACAAQRCTCGSLSDRQSVRPPPAVVAAGPCHRSKDTGQRAQPAAVRRQQRLCRGQQGRAGTVARGGILTCWTEPFRSRASVAALRRPAGLLRGGNSLPSQQETLTGIPRPHPTPLQPTPTLPLTRVPQAPSRPVNQSWFSDRSPIITPQQSSAIVAALQQLGVLDSSGWLRDDPRQGLKASGGTSGSRLRAGLRLCWVAASGDALSLIALKCFDCAHSTRLVSGAAIAGCPLAAECQQPSVSVDAAPAGGPALAERHGHLCGARPERHHRR